MSDGKQQNWTEEIGAKHLFFSVNLIEVWRYRDLFFMFVKRFCLLLQTNDTTGLSGFYNQSLPLLPMLLYLAK